MDWHVSVQSAAKTVSSYIHFQFQYINDPHGLWDPKLVLERHIPEYPYDEKLEPPIQDVQKVLNYPIDQETLDFAAYNSPASSPSPRSSQVSHTLSCLMGQWNGLNYSPATALVPRAGMISMVLLPVEGRSRHFQASSRSNSSDFSISGECHASQSRGVVEFAFKRSFPARFPPQYFRGSWSMTTDTMTGTWGLDSDPHNHDGIFVFKRMTPENLCWLPAPVEFKANKPRALWSFAISAVCYSVRKSRWSWAFFRERRDNRKRFIELYIRSTKFGRPLNAGEEAELGRVKKSLTTADSRFYHSLAERQIRRTTGHG